MPHTTVNATISFSLEPFADQGRQLRCIVPLVNKVALTTLIAEYERQQEFDLPHGGYAGIIPSFFNYGPLDHYFLGNFEQNRFFSGLGGIYVLGCECGEVGCWPLQCAIVVETETVSWHRFQQPHRRKRNYSLFGPFVFDRKEYENAVARLCADYAEHAAAEPR